MVRYAMFPESEASHVALMERRFEVAPYPVPEWTSRQEWPTGFAAPDAVLRLELFAREHGWQTDVRYARGRMPHAKHGRPLALKHLVSVRIGLHPRTQRQAVAVYSSTVRDTVWSWGSVWVWGPDLNPYGKLGVMDLKVWLESGGQPGQHWFDAVTERVKAQMLAARQKANERAKTLKPRESGG